MPEERNFAAPRLQPWWIRLALALPFLAIVATAVPQLADGLAQEAAYTATAYMAMDVPLPRRSYRLTAAILSHASSSDGEAQIARAEAASLAGQSPAMVAPIAEAALNHAPASARGWIVLARLLEDRNPRRAAAALNLALELAPREYYLVGPRVEAGAPLWKYLPQDARDTLLGDARMLVTDPDFHQSLLALLAEPGGPELLTRTFAGHPDELRAFNRNMARERLGL